MKLRLETGTSICLLCIVLLLAVEDGTRLQREGVQAQQTGYYVALNGDDYSGDGSFEKPWASITHAVNNVPDGSTIFVLSGIYSERLRLDRQFEIGITIRSETAFLARLRNNGIVVTSYRGQGITLEGVDVVY